VNGGLTISDDPSAKSPSAISLDVGGGGLGANLNRLMSSRSSSRDDVIETSFIQKTFEGMDSESTYTSGEAINIKDIDESKVQKMNAAVRMNQVILEYSSESQLVLLSLPKPPKSAMPLVENYLAYVEALTEKLPRCMLIGGSGKEVITVDS